MQCALHCVVWRAQTDGVGESIVYVSEPQPMAHTAEEVIDMVENPVTSEVSGWPLCRHAASHVP